ncbi:hypothetical protein VC83_08197 [Pseudogymnoascus destructans]|uniref:Uncharacterized protein n=1 Tax=Pseudogymnoascus destructans TaxID=655981 RepID=A0A177A2A2_9PEZI|nr:uncharacterized protein VC83_08197 [Pseudogymnoascus destructans]OAF55213.1 hypothetical protein VC83_08197 [Pseudogymnoascus destructans]
MDPAVKTPDLKAQEPTHLRIPNRGCLQTSSHSLKGHRNPHRTNHDQRIVDLKDLILSNHPRGPGSESQESSVPDLFSLAGKIIIVTRAACGIGLTMSESLIECGAIVHALDLLPGPSPEFDRLAASLPKGTPTYHPIDVLDIPALDTLVASIAQTHSGSHGLIAAARIQH